MQSVFSRMKFCFLLGENYCYTFDEDSSSSLACLKLACFLFNHGVSLESGSTVRSFWAAIVFLWVAESYLWIAEVYLWGFDTTVVTFMVVASTAY